MWADTGGWVGGQACSICMKALGTGMLLLVYTRTLGRGVQLYACSCLHAWKGWKLARVSGMVVD